MGQELKIAMFLGMVGCFLLIVNLFIKSVKDASASFQLPRKFSKMNPLQGKSRKQIEFAVGAPNSVSGVEDGKIVCQWIVPGYHIALRFDSDGPEANCEGVTHESIG